jgi:predicted amidohydrolase
VKIEVAIAQIKPRKGDYEANLRRLGEVLTQLEEDAPETNVLVLPETALTGYFLEGGVRDVARTKEQIFTDLLCLYREVVSRPEASLDICLGFYELHDNKYYNSALYATLTAHDGPAEPPMAQSGIRHVHRKFFLPTYGVFDEKRFVSRGRSINAFETQYGNVAVLICEDVWHSITATIAALKGAHILFIISASPGREFTGQHVGNVTRWNVLLPGMPDWSASRAAKGSPALRRSLIPGATAVFWGRRQRSVCCGPRLPWRMSR